jgi:uncharacterized 2Fe-2S/4Fe-4S cluster protein (DUF4445 family)
VPTSCDKQGTCKECLVEVTEGMEHLSPRSPEERHLQEGFRLACRCRIVDGEGIVRCQTLRRGAIRVERRAYHLPVQDRPVPLEPCVTREGGRVLLDGREIARSTGPIHGLAMDLGTTTVVLRLFDLETGEVVADSSFENPQRFGGSDVIARIHYDTHHRGKLLQRTLAGYLGHAIAEFPVDPRSIYEVVVAGNATMRDLFFRLDVHSIGQSPYRSVTEIAVREGKRATTSVTASARRLRLDLHPRARVYGLPVVSGHVGADAAACMLAVDLAHEERLVAVMDIGTNTELILGNRHRILAASCPAGPAFEGGRIGCGMPALPGAIERVRILPDGGVRTTVIGDGPAQGICGSGLVDALAELLRTGRINRLGRFEDGTQEAVLDRGGPRPITLHERDINELAQAKGANVAGLHVVFDTYGTRFEDVEVFYLAGGFGQHLDVGAARAIGLVPDLDEARILQVGDAAIEGAGAALLSRSRRAELERLVARVGHCRLETHPAFFHYFVEGCQFGPVGAGEPSDAREVL